VLSGARQLPECASPPPQVSISAGDMTGEDVYLKNFFSKLYNSGDFLIFASAGNNGTRLVSYPAGFDSVISVSALDSSRSWARFSNYNAATELSAPGEPCCPTMS
jgi:hypothetical protein